MSVHVRNGVEKVKESATLAINQRVGQMRKNGEEVTHFGFGESPFPVPPALERALQCNAHQKAYLPTRGLPELCKAIADFYRNQFGYEYSESHVVVGPGSKELLFQLMFLLEGPLLLPAPSWVSYGPQAQLCGKQVLIVPTDIASGFQVNVDKLEAACTHLDDRQKLLILNSPNNPTGRCLRQDEVEAIADVCRRNNILVISDEIYAMTHFSEGQLPSLAREYPEGTIVTGGLSKAYSAGGYRIGLVLLPDHMDNLRDAMAATISETFSAVSAPSQYAALAVYGDFAAVSGHVQTCTRIHALAGHYLYTRFTEMGLDCLPPEGGFYLFPGFSKYKEALAAKGIINSEQLARYLLDEAAVAVLPGTDFMMKPEVLHVRVASVDYNGARAIESFLAGERQPEALFPLMVAGCDRLQALLATLK